MTEIFVYLSVCVAPITYEGKSQPSSLWREVGSGPEGPGGSWGWLALGKLGLGASPPTRRAHDQESTSHRMDTRSNALPNNRMAAAWLPGPLSCTSSRAQFTAETCVWTHPPFGSYAKGHVVFTLSLLESNSLRVYLRETHSTSLALVSVSCHSTDILTF